jgi:hypothetical protein
VGRGERLTAEVAFSKRQLNGFGDIETSGIIQKYMASLLLMVGGSIFVLMGCIHGVVALIDVFQPTQFTPMDDSVRLAMKSTRVRFLTARANVWDSWLGFNISHSLGMLIFGVAAIYLAVITKQITVAKMVLVFPTAIGTIYFILSLGFWFYAPAVGSLAATICFLAAWLTY